MSQVEKDTGRPLIWAAVNHYNTDNPHVHIVIRGVDRDGDDLRIDGRYIGREMRWRAQEILTRELGPRSELDLTQERSADITREAFTPIDRMLAGYLSQQGTLTSARLAGAPSAERAACLGRLDTLEQLQLAHREPAGAWRLQSGWEAALADMGSYAEALERLARIVPAHLDQRRVLKAGRPFETIEGVVRGMGLHDEQGGAMFIAVTTPTGAAYYVPVRPEVAQSVRVGEPVRVSSPIESWVKSTDRIITRCAQQNDNVYDPAVHRRALEALRSRETTDASPSAADLITANIRRLERLERYGLAARLPEGRWLVPPDLVAQIEGREKSHPQHRVRVEQPGAERAPRDRGHATEAAERPKMGADLAKQLGLTYVERPEHLRGRLFACAPTAQGREYVRIVDFATNRFTLVPRPPDALRLEGRMVTVTLDHRLGLSIGIDRGISR